MMVYLWTQTLDRDGLSPAISTLDQDQRTALMDRLGYHNFVSNIGVPWGCHFKLQIALNVDQEQVCF